jgi:cytochrome c
MIGGCQEWIAAWSCGAALFIAADVAAPGGAKSAPDRGEVVFQKCYACHSVNPAETNLPGPNLAGVVGRRAAALESFEYSPALKAAGQNSLVWDEETLDRFLADPEAMIPGTYMSLPGLHSAEERRAVIAYLKTQP